MQDAGAVAGATHARIGQANHVAHTLGQEFARDGQLAPFGHAGAALWPGIAQHQHMVGGDVQIFVIHSGLHLGVAVKNHGWTCVLAQMRRAGAGFDHGTCGGDVAFEHRQGPFGIQRAIQRADHIRVVHLRCGHVLAQRLAIDRHGIQVQVV